MAKCLVCKKIGVDHVGAKCPDRCTPSCKQLGALSGRVRPESTVKGCDGYHITSQHECYVCKKIGADHTEKDCPDRCTVEGCDGYHLNSQHFYCVCKKIGADRNEKDYPDRCTVKKCSHYHITLQHRCWVCDKIGVNHLADDCPDRCIIKGCLHYHITSQHRCSVCKKIGADHNEEDCPNRCTPSCKQLGALSGRVRPESTIEGCGSPHLTSRHWCGVCKTIGADHNEKDCSKRCTPSC